MSLKVAMGGFKAGIHVGDDRRAIGAGLTRGLVIGVVQRRGVLVRVRLHSHEQWLTKCVKTGLVALF